MLKLKPTERLIKMSLQLTPDQTIEQINQSVGINQRFHGMNALRILLASNLVIANDTTPVTYRIAEGS